MRKRSCHQDSTSALFSPATPLHMHTSHAANTTQSETRSNSAFISITMEHEWSTEQDQIVSASPQMACTRSDSNLPVHGVGCACPQTGEKPNRWGSCSSHDECVPLRLSLRRANLDAGDERGEKPSADAIQTRLRLLSRMASRAGEDSCRYHEEGSRKRRRRRGRRACRSTAIMARSCAGALSDGNDTSRPGRSAVVLPGRATPTLSSA